MNETAYGAGCGEAAQTEKYAERQAHKSNQHAVSVVEQVSEPTREQKKKEKAKMKAYNNKFAVAEKDRCVRRKTVELYQYFIELQKQRTQARLAEQDEQRAEVAVEVQAPGSRLQESVLVFYHGTKGANIKQIRGTP